MGNVFYMPPGAKLENVCLSATGSFILMPAWVDQMKEARAWLEGIRAKRKAESWLDDDS